MSVQLMMSYHMMFSNQFYTMQLFSLCNSGPNVLSTHTLQNILESLLNSDSIYDIIF